MRKLLRDEDRAKRKKDRSTGRADNVSTPESWGEVAGTAYTASRANAAFRLSLRPLL